MAEVELRELPDPVPLPQAHEALGRLLEKVIAELGPAHFPEPHRMDDAAWVGYRVAELLPVTPERKQKLLEQPEPLALLREVEQVLAEVRGPDGFAGG
jgi:Lon protease-like protein